MSIGPAPNKKTVPRVRMLDIAHLADVTRPTVSYVLSGNYSQRGISEKTAEKIRHIARRLRFYPSHAARQLAGKRSGIIGALAETWCGQTEQRLSGWLNKLASDRGRKILAWPLEADPEALDKFVDECLGWGVDGLVFMAFKYDVVWPQVAKALERLPLVVSILGNPGIPGGYTVESDVVDGVWQSVEHLHRQGRKRVVQLLEGTDAQMDRQRYDAFLKAHREIYGIEPDDAQVCLASAGWMVEDYAKYQELAREMVADRGADAILSDSDFSATALLRGLTRLGYRIPEDIALVGWGYEIVGRGLTPSLTTVDFDFEQIVGRALDVLTGLIERPDEEQPRSIVVKPKLIVRESA